MLQECNTHAANDVSQEINPATDAALIAENNADFAKCCNGCYINARSDIDPATDAALNAGNNADFTKILQRMLHYAHENHVFAKMLHPM